MYSNFQPKYYFWDTTIYFRKAAFAASSTLFRAMGVHLQCISGLIILFIVHYLHAKVQPYRSASLNKSESHSLVVLLVTLVCGLALEAPPVFISKEFRVVIAAVIFTINIGFFVFMIYHIHANGQVRVLISLLVYSPEQRGMVVEETTVLSRRSTINEIYHTS